MSKGTVGTGETYAAYNQRAWNRQVKDGCRWTVPVDAAAIERARRGDLELILTPKKAVPRAWLPSDLHGVRVLGLASSGGQQLPLLAAAGARVTALDLSPSQLKRDAEVAEREGLEIQLEEGEMTDLSRFADESFDLVFHPVSNVFVPDVRPVWREVARVLRTGGELLAGFINPLFFIFDDAALDRGELDVRYPIPYADPDHMDEASLESLLAREEPICFGHSLEDQLGGQSDVGLAIIGMYEDRWEDKAIDKYIATFMATRARKLSCVS